MSHQPLIPPSVFASVAVGREHLYIAFREKDNDTITHDVTYINNITPLDNLIFDRLQRYQEANHVKVIAAGLGEAINPEQLGENLWLQQDIVPFLLRGRGIGGRERSANLVEYIATTFRTAEGLDIAEVSVDDRRAVHPSHLTTLQAYEDISSHNDFAWLRSESKRFNMLQGNICFINSTPQGGGVALMRHAQIRLYRLLGVSASWHVMTPKAEVFEITKKKFHNVLQGVAPANVVLTDEDKEVYNAWIAENAELFHDTFRHANVIVIDDWQPSGLIPTIKEVNPEAKIIFRSHIHVDTSLFHEGSPQRVTWDFVWDHNRIKDVDIFIAHPIPEFVPSIVPPEKVVLMPATTDPLDGLNKPLTEEQLDYYLAQFNRLITHNQQQQPLDLERPYIVQIARFDPSKGIPDVLEAYRYLRELCARNHIPRDQVPQLVIAGHGAVDDPEGIPILQETHMTLTLDRFADIAPDIKLARLPHNDQILNALLRKSTIALQLSHKEGCEVKVTEALHKAKPIIIYTAGGMHLQVIDDVNSFVLPVGKTEQVAEHLYKLLTDTELYHKMSKNAAKRVKQQFFTVNNAFNWLFLANELLERGGVTSNAEHVTTLMARAGKE